MELPGGYIEQDMVVLSIDIGWGIVSRDFHLRKRYNYFGISITIFEKGKSDNRFFSVLKQLKLWNGLALYIFILQAF